MNASYKRSKFFFNLYMLRREGLPLHLKLLYSKKTFKTADRNTNFQQSQNTTLMLQALYMRTHFSSKKHFSDYR